MEHYQSNLLKLSSIKRLKDIKICLYGNTWKSWIYICTYTRIPQRGILCFSHSTKKPASAEGKYILLEIDHVSSHPIVVIFQMTPV
ncbi:uncharacterized protein BDW43DRAFT_95956 [Aspergillus alliaceus]|uniref:uncharacterized protein n=1 Tax=Petromyces alliaceus TaxID=209559 RepID=UPI0012A6584E|nr:uncharacterized protein BDW43DRAFT_95956 [Aspergillus alliaceus]KAB8233160.1 hypothetical protein BDW43DRAFT_95956 [Aspergillus alliaceus]